MNTYFAYLRVSTVKQGDGVSLEAQREAIETYASKHDLRVVEWFEEKVTAAKRGRPLFNKMIVGLQRGQASGVIVHKIDRSARNFADWAKIGELIDEGIDVRFAHESLDMRSRGGRLTADIQAVIAADYVRNLREECLKGIEGRLKQGLFPFGAPIGYLDCGAGKPKVPDPERAPYVRMAYELYASGGYSIRSLLAELHSRGFRNKAGKPVSKTSLEWILQNPFYSGQITIRRTGRTYTGIHEPIVDARLYKRVQNLKADKHRRCHTKHNHTFRRCITCGHCSRSLVGELQKGHVYMRCQTKGCPTTSIREDRIDAAMLTSLLGVQLSDLQAASLKERAEALCREAKKKDVANALELQLSANVARAERLTDALLDKIIDEQTYTSRKLVLDDESSKLRTALNEARSEGTRRESVDKFLELARSVALYYEMANATEKRELAKIAFSNRTLTGKNLCLVPRNCLAEPKETLAVLCGPHERDTTRTVREIRELNEWASTCQLTM